MMPSTMNAAARHRGRGTGATGFPVLSSKATSTRPEISPNPCSWSVAPSAAPTENITAVEVETVQPAARRGASRTTRTRKRGREDQGRWTCARGSTTITIASIYTTLNFVADTPAPGGPAGILLPRRQRPRQRRACLRRFGRGTTRTGQRAPSRPPWVRQRWMRSLARGKIASKGGTSLRAPLVAWPSTA